jgi:hypothetical protein
MHESIALAPGGRSARPAPGASRDQSHWTSIRTMSERLVRDRCGPTGDEEVADGMLQTRHRTEGLAEGRKHHEVAALLADAALSGSGIGGSGIGGSGIGGAGIGGACRRRRLLSAADGSCALREAAQTVDHTHLLALRS